MQKTRSVDVVPTNTAAAETLVVQTSAAGDMQKSCTHTRRTLPCRLQTDVAAHPINGHAFSINMTLSAWSPNGFRFFCMALSLSVLIVELLKSIVDLVPGEMVNFIVYNAYGFAMFNICLYIGRSVLKRKLMWFLNGFLASAVFLLWYASLFNPGDIAYLPAVYSVELMITACVANSVRQFEHPKNYEDLARFRNEVIPVHLLSKTTELSSIPLQASQPGRRFRRARAARRSVNPM